MNLKIMNNNSNKEILYLENINFSYIKDEKELFKNFSLKIEERDFISIIGPNGSGKTTIFKLIIKELSPLSGQIFLKSKEIKHWKRKEIAKIISYLPQKIPVNLNYNVLDYVVMGRYPYKEIFEDYNHQDYDIAESYLKMLDIGDIKDRSFSNLSGGEQRRVMLAQALTSQSQILLLDEPDSFLDIGHKKEFYEILSFLNKDERKTIITISHDLQLAFSYSKKICGIKNGKISFIENQNNISEKLLSDLYGTDLFIYKDKDRIAVVY